jgi:hypothetical protein
MKKRLKMAVLPAIVVGVLLLAFPALAGEPKVTICHVPPGNPDNKHTITVGASAVPAHLAHGDFLGDCSGPEPLP